MGHGPVQKNAQVAHGDQADKNAYNFCLDYAQTLLRDFTDSILYKGSTIVMS
jgi:hypothetical protein